MAHTSYKHKSVYAFFGRVRQDPLAAILAIWGCSCSSSIFFLCSKTVRHRWTQEMFSKREGSLGETLGIVSERKKSCRHMWWCAWLRYYHFWLSFWLSRCRHGFKPCCVAFFFKISESFFFLFQWRFLLGNDNRLANSHIHKQHIVWATTERLGQPRPKRRCSNNMLQVNLCGFAWWFVFLAFFFFQVTLISCLRSDVKRRPPLMKWYGHWSTIESL